MTESGWLVPVAVVAGGIAGGILLLALTRKRHEPGPGAEDSRSEARPTPTPRRGLSPKTVGALQGGAFVAAMFGIYLAVQSGSSPREGGMSMTGSGMAPARTSGAIPPSPDGTAASDSAPSLAPIPSAELDAARAHAVAHPESHDAKVRLGWALVDARGWIDVFHLVEQLIAEDREDLDALALAAPVQLAMGQRDAAVELLERVLAERPDDLRALLWRGHIADLDGDTAARDDYWERARKNAGGADLDAMIASFADLPAPRPHATSAARPPRAAAISGTVALAPGAVAPAGATLFVMARMAGVTAGPPLATRRIDRPTFPLAFVIGPQDVMMQGVVFGGALSIEARLDGDGDARTRSPIDLHATSSEPVEPGARGVELLLAPP